jgi:hypothetical protein
VTRLCRSTRDNLAAVTSATRRRVEFVPMSITATRWEGASLIETGL